MTDVTTECPPCQNFAPREPRAPSALVDAAPPILTQLDPGFEWEEHEAAP